MTLPPKNLQGLLAWPEDYPEILFLERTEVLVPGVVLLWSRPKKRQMQKKLDKL
jgi:hypothetical protein